jgi:carboxymethylenebutenolidase
MERLVLDDAGTALERRWQGSPPARRVCSRAVKTQELPLGYLAHAALDERTPTVPGVVLIHDVWGLLEHPRDLARRLAGEGFAVLAIDLYRREVTITDAARWIRELSDPQAVADVQAGIDFLAGHPACRGRKVGVIGFCMGGMYALLAGCECRGLSAIVPFYGLLSHRHGLLHDPRGLDPMKKPRQPLDAVRDLRCPLLGIFAGRDEYVALPDIEELGRRARATGEPAEIVVYPEATHAFMNDMRPSAYRPADARDAWSRMLAFLRQHLG